VGDTAFQNGVLPHPDGVEIARLFEPLIECQDRVGGVSAEEGPIGRLLRRITLRENKKETTSLEASL
jgi:hypothetical protein